MNTKNALMLTVLALTTFGNSVQADLSSWFRTPNMSYITAQNVTGLTFGLLALHTTISAIRNSPQLKQKAQDAQATINMLEDDINKVANKELTGDQHKYLPAGIFTEPAKIKINNKSKKYHRALRIQEIVTNKTDYTDVNAKENAEDCANERLDVAAQNYDNALVARQQKAIAIRQKANTQRYKLYAIPALFAGASALCFYFGNRK